MLSRIKDFFTFSKQERNNLLLAVLLLAFIFSFRDWGRETFSLTEGLRHFILMLLVVSISIFARISCQKLYGLSNGYKIEFRVWWTGLLISLILAFITFGKVPTILLGGATSAFMVRQRLGEFRYGYSYWQSGMISLWAFYASLILATLFAVGKYAFPENYFFAKGVIFNLIMGFCALLPLPQLEGANIFFAARWLYAVAIVLLGVTTLLLLVNTAWSLIIIIVGTTIIATVYLITGSEK
ncbi:hypothetical protein HYX13_00075 [Candidatus Woesearchaeota archaeon]|nr:hypothetical protein [Candidatus Woesearchaeota archaeon]